MAVPPRYNVLGVGVSALDLDQARDLVISRKSERPAGYICCATAHGLVEARGDPALRHIYNESFLTTPDGMPVVWLGPPGVSRVYGPDLMLEVCAAGRAVGLRHFLFGGLEGVAQRLGERLSEQFPGIRIVGTHTPPVQEPDDRTAAALREQLATAKPDVVWIGLGSPKQERFMGKYAATMDASLLIGVGAAFDFHSGRIRQAPRWMQRSGLEWLFRLGNEPRRLGHRYLVNNPRFLAAVIAQKIGLRKYPVD
jgi:N-acetylglucosaminyldiphosphoundecaprenol N-acetyl-beta-D-mannosaminyltransferase